MSSDTPRWKPSFVPDPLTYLVELQAVLPWRMVVDRHFVYGAMDRSARTGAGRVRPSFDNSWGCFDQCRPHKEEAEAGRVLSGFHNLSMFVSIVPNGERAVAQRLAKALGYLYVTVPTGYHLAVLSTGPLGEHSTEVVDKDRHMKKVLMKVRWFGSISSSHGFLPKARDAVGWEAYHPQTGRRCSHVHDFRGGAEACAIETGMDLDDSPDGWYVRSCSEWMRVGTVRMTTLSGLAVSAEDCGLDVTLYEFAGSDDGDLLLIHVVEWDDSRFVRFREENRWKPPRTPTGERHLPRNPQEWSIDTRGRVAGSG